MGERTTANITAGVAEFLEPDETVVATLLAQPRGHSQAMAGGVAGIVGSKRAGAARRDADGAGIELAGTMALVLTRTRLLMVRTGNGAKVKGLLGAYSLGEVSTMDVKRLGLGGTVTLTILGTRLNLESRVGAAREFADHLAQARAA